MDHNDRIRLFGEGPPLSPFKPGIEAFTSKPQTSRTLMLELAKLKAKIEEYEKLYDKWRFLESSRLLEDLTAKAILSDLKSDLKDLCVQ